ncbi:MAG: hypothetical protein GY822_20615 [Deltaproteobacteria bacterium]|nr:hypothetical protein [Deltaproteobacteria bacterium]
MSLPTSLFELIRCPKSGQKLALAPDATVKLLNEKIEKGRIYDVGDLEVVDRVDALLLREDGAVLYPIRDDIPVLLTERGITAGLIGANARVS